MSLVTMEDSSPAAAISKSFHLNMKADSQQIQKISKTPQDYVYDRSTTHPKYYILPRPWMDQFQKYISETKEERDRPSQISNTHFMVTNNDAQDSSSSSNNNNNSHASHIHTPTSYPTHNPNQSFRPNQSHGIEFYLVGHNTWRLLSMKFGYDLELAFHIYPKSQLHKLLHDGTTFTPKPYKRREEMVVLMYPDYVWEGIKSQDGTSMKCREHAFVPIPEDGMFEYDVSLAQALKYEFSGDLTIPYYEGKVERESKSKSGHGGGQGTSTSSGNGHEDGNDMPALDTVEEDDAMADTTSSDPPLLLPPSTTSAANTIQDDETEFDKIEMQDYTNDPTTTTASTDDAIPKLLPASTTTCTAVGTNTYSSSGYTNWNSNKVDDEEESTALVVKDENPRKRKRCAKGLGNLGNTCFMNSTLQCLAHTQPLRQYFLSGDYIGDLNRDNPLGTRGELATEFAKLLSQMWGTSQAEDDSYNTRNTRYGSYSSNFYSNSSSSTVYPSNFKSTLGRHAEQFIGYNQHDSQELATYLLDALHEDTNHVTKKPYVEKPEQAEDESDEVASQKAWDLHLKRENSRVLDNFMGQVKSRVKCPEAGCGRISTTFDPFMYLSVPIPGVTDRTLQITFVPIDPNQSSKVLKVTLPKDAMFKEAGEKIAEIANENNLPCQSDDIVFCEVWQNDIYGFHDNDQCIDKVKDSDDTFAFQVESKLAILAETAASERKAEEASKLDLVKVESEGRILKIKAETMGNLNKRDDWVQMLKQFLVQPLSIETMTNTKRSKHDERMNFHKNLSDFLQKCYETDEYKEYESKYHTGVFVEDYVAAANEKKEKSSAAGSISYDDDEHDENMLSPNRVESPEHSLNHDDGFRTIKDVCLESDFLERVEDVQDLGVLRFCSNKFYQFCKNESKQTTNQHRGGVEIQVIVKKEGARFSTYSSYGSEKAVGEPLLLRISPQMTVYELRQLLAQRLQRAFQQAPKNAEVNDESNVEEDGKEEKTESANDMQPLSPKSDTSDYISPDGNYELDLMRRIPFSYERKNNYSYGYNSYSRSHAHRQLGSVPKQDDKTDQSDIVALQEDEDEQTKVLDVIGVEGKVIIHWPKKKVLNTLFNEKVFTETEDWSKPVANEEEKDSTVPSVISCIEKYCQEEQLEETDMWYCNKCKEHVRAWKLTNIYRAPPILIIHLKRFHFSSFNHRRDKIDSLIDFPLKGLDLRQTVMKWEEGEEPIYDCYAVSNHYGGLGGGHYTAYARNDEGEWNYFDDSRVTTNVDENEVVSSAAYVLYYQRRDVKVGDESKPDPNSSVISSEDSTSSKVMDIDQDAVENSSDIFTTSSQTCQSPTNSTMGAISDEDMEQVVTRDVEL